MKIGNQFYPCRSIVRDSSHLFSRSASGQTEQRRERTIDEIKAEAIHRAEVGQYPLIGLDPGDVKEAFESIHTSDKDEWAAGIHARGRSLLQRSEVAGEIGPRQSKCRLHSRLAALFLRTLADSGVSGQAAILRKGARSVSGTRTLLRSAARSRAHSFRRQRNHRLPAPAEKCEGPGAAGDCSQWIGQPQGRSD